MRDKFKLPKPIGDIHHFTWGPVVDVHFIGPYAIVEFHPRIFTRHVGTDDHDLTKTMFHPYIKNGDDPNHWLDLHCETNTLDGSLLTAIVSKRVGVARASNGCYAQHAARLLHVDEEGS